MSPWSSCRRYRGVSGSRKRRDMRYSAPTEGSSPTLRVAVYAAPRPVSAMHAGTTNVNIKKNAVASVSLALGGTGVNTGSSYGFGFDIVSLVKPFELQFTRTGIFNQCNILKYVGVTSDLASMAPSGKSAVYTFGIEGFGDAAVPEFNSSDKEIVHRYGSRWHVRFPGLPDLDPERDNS